LVVVVGWVVVVGFVVVVGWVVGVGAVVVGGAVVGACVVGAWVVGVGIDGAELPDQISMPERLANVPAQFPISIVRSATVAGKGPSLAQLPVPPVVWDGTTTARSTVTL
jgi:hypothetical protein